MTTRQIRTRATRSTDFEAKRYVEGDSRIVDESDGEVRAEDCVMSKHARTTSEPDASGEARAQGGAARSHALDEFPIDVPATFDSGESRAQKGAAPENHAPDRSSAGVPAAFGPGESRARWGAARKNHALDGSPVNAPANFDGSEPRTLAGAASNYTPSCEYSNGTTTFTTEGTQVQESVVCDHTLGRGHTNAPTNFNTERFLSTMMETFARTQAETNRTLREALQSIHHGDQWNSPGRSPAPSTTAGFAATRGNFSKCSVRFDGESRDAEMLEAFIDSVEVYKECAAVSDEHRLRGLPMLLAGNAAVWWRGARASITTWPDALALLRAAYGGVQKPAYCVLREVFAIEQNDSERAEVFISRVRSLLVRLSYLVPHVMQVDIIFGLLHRMVRKRLSRDDCISVDNKLKACQ